MLLTPFLHRCRQQPEALALVEGDTRLDYRGLLDRSLVVAAALRNRGIGPGQRVAIHLDRGIEAVAAVFGCLLAGACSVPLDIKNPPARLQRILDDAGPAAVLGSGEPPEGWEGPAWLDVARSPEAEWIPPDCRADDLAVILYTSGSTGQPKGVAMSHGAVAAFSEWAADLLGLVPADRIASSAPLFFDLSTFDLYAALGRGSSLHVMPSVLTLSPARLAAWLKDKAISGWYTVPSLLAFLAYKGNLAETPLDALRFLIFAGEVLPTPALRRLAEQLPTTAFYNFFGPTETNVCCYWPVDRSRLDTEDAIPIGLPACGDSLEINPADGELWVRGPSLLSGYWSLGGLRAAVDGAGWYRTGDRVFRNARGEYGFHGRLGRMLKCSGYRVEPAEIEAAIAAVPGVRGCAVAGLDDPAAGQRPAALLVLDPPVTVEQVRESLRRCLPAYMQPARYRVVAALPWLENGKLDYLKVQILLSLKDSGSRC